jgi:ABC-type Fe3+/spermidine/putrescine transport system ATPase subunit
MNEMLGRDGDPIILAFEGVSRTFGSRQVLSDIALALRQGEILTLLGPSGCGKTTTLRLAIGFERANAGRIVYCGHAIDCPHERVYVPPERRDMGMVFQSYAVWPHLTVFENVAFPLRARRTPATTVDREVRDALKLVGLEEFEARAGTALSGGQQQRVAVARALVHKPKLLLMDEPFSNLDAKLRDQLRTELKTLQRRLKFSILFVTHDQTEALALSDRVAVMRGGRIEQVGTPFELYTAPASPFVRDFVGQSISFDGRILPGTGISARLEEGSVLQVAGVNHMAAARAGLSCQITVRPEDINVVVGDAIGGSNQIPGRIRTALFLGPTYELAVELSNGQVVAIMVPRTTEWREGQKVRLELPPEKLQLWGVS